MKRVADQLRELAEQLKKQGAEESSPKPTPNPTASRAQGDLGSLDSGPKSVAGGNKLFTPKLPKVGV